MYNPYSIYVMYLYLRNIYGVYVTIRFLKYLLGSMYDIFVYFYSFVRKEEQTRYICDRRKSTYTEL